METVKKMIVPDTNILLQAPEVLEQFQCVLLTHVNREIEKHELSKNDLLRYQVRNLKRYMDKYENNIVWDNKDYKVTFDEYDEQYVDNKILQACIDNRYSLITNDRGLRNKARQYGVELIHLENINKKYDGYIEVYESDNKLVSVYEDANYNTYELLLNQYLVIKNYNEEIIDMFKWNGQYHEKVKHNYIVSSNMFGKFIPLDSYQKLALDSLFNNQATLIKGAAGTGKSLIALSYAWSMVEKGKYDKLIIFTNPVKTKNATALGYYKGDRTTKLLDSQIGIMLTSKFGSKEEVERYITEGSLMLLPFSDIRGFDTSGMNAIVWFTESQNLDKELMKLGIQRCSSDSKIIVDGDPYTQVDLDAYAGNNNGMLRMSEVFRDRNLYGEVTLKNIYRSELAKIAEEM